MSPSSSPLSLALKLEIQRRAASGETDSQIAQTLNVSKWTVRKWRRRIDHHGRGGLAVQRGRPRGGALSTFSSDLRQTLRDWRQAHPGWGAKTLRARLAVHPDWHAQPLPHPSQIARFLRQEGLTRRYHRHTHLPPTQRPVPAEPHQEWQLDAQAAQKVETLGWVIVLNTCDVVSRVKVGCWAIGVARAQSKATVDDHYLALRRCFLRAGLPDRLAVDHDSVYFDRSPSPFPTRLHLWLTALGVQLVFGRFGQPTDQAEVERTHQLMTQQALVGQTFATPTLLQDCLDATLDFVNTALPCRSLAQQPPLVAYPQAAQPRRRYRPDLEAQLLDLDRVDDLLAAGQWVRLVSGNGWISLGDYRYKVGKTYAGQHVEIRWDRTTRHFGVHGADGTQGPPLTPKGLAVRDLMGEAAPILAWDELQLALPFDAPAWRQLQVAALAAA